VAETLRRRGEVGEVGGYRLVSARVSVVARMRADAPARDPFGVVVKHVPAEVYGAGRRDRWRSEFLEEAAAYSFLARPEVGFRERPELLGFHRNGVLVLEDLGEGADPVVPLSAVEPGLARSLARLHAATLGRGAAHREERRRFGLDPDAADRRHDGTTAAVRRRASGSALIGTWAAALAVPEAEGLEELLDPVVEAVESPGRWHALIHDDLANHRQCRTRGGRTLLLDFENARYGHALLDLGKLLVGKFERDLVEGDMFHALPGFGATLAGRYRVELAAAAGEDPGDRECEAALTDAVLYSVLVQVGSLVELTGRTQVRGGLLRNLAALLGRLEAVLDPSGPRAPLRRLLGELGVRASLGAGLSERSGPASVLPTAMARSIPDGAAPPPA
jgi:hypothetical protein